MDWPFSPLTPMKYGVIYADPPWAYEMRSEKGHERSPEAHYDTMKIGDIKALPVSHLAGPDCLLFLWSTWPHLPQALGVMAAWGFAYKTGGAWVKRTSTGKVAMGTGYIMRGATEPFLIGTIGRPKVADRSIRNVLIDGPRREHSRKPPQAREMLRKLLPDAWACELFATEPWAEADIWAPKAHVMRGGDDV